MTQLGYAGPLYYRPSGKTPPARLLAALLTVIPAAIVLALVYAVATAYLPNLGYVKLVLIVAVLLVMGFGFGVGGLTGVMLRWARVRSVTASWLVALLAAVVAYYVSWVVWEALILRRDGLPIPLQRLVPRLLQRPDAVWFFANRINEAGTFVIGRDETAIHGVVLWILWAVEAAVVIGLGTRVPAKMLRGLAFCEACGRWCENRQGVVSLAHGDEAALRSRLEGKDLSVLEEYGAADMDAPRQLRVDLQECPTCGQMHLLSVSRIDVYYDHGNRKEKVVPVVDRLVISSEEAQAVRDLRDRRRDGFVPAPIAAPQVKAEEKPVIPTLVQPTDPTAPAPESPRLGL